MSWLTAKSSTPHKAVLLHKAHCKCRTLKTRLLMMILQLTSYLTILQVRIFLILMHMSTKLLIRNFTESLWWLIGIEGSMYRSSILKISPKSFLCSIISCKNMRSLSLSGFLILKFIPGRVRILNQSKKLSTPFCYSLSLINMKNPSISPIWKTLLKYVPTSKNNSFTKVSLNSQIQTKS